MSDSGYSIDEICSNFDSEFQKLGGFVDAASDKLDSLALSEVVAGYFQAATVNSLVLLLGQNADSKTNTAVSERIAQAKSLVSEFDKTLHPRILLQLTESIKKLHAQIESAQDNAASKTDIESSADLYAQLREQMSAKEFVEQYGKGIE